LGDVGGAKVYATQPCGVLKHAPDERVIRFTILRLSLFEVILQMNRVNIEKKLWSAGGYGDRG
jgi:hypothetical protein